METYTLNKYKVKQTRIHII